MIPSNKKDIDSFIQMNLNQSTIINNKPKQQQHLIEEYFPFIFSFQNL